MIVNTFEFSVAAAAAATNLAPSAFNPVPDDGVIDIFAVQDSGITSLTVPAKIQVQLGGATNATPVLTSSITGDPYALQTAGNFGDPTVCPVITGLPVRKATNIQVNVSGGTGATSTGRIKMVFRTAADVTAGVGG